MDLAFNTEPHFTLWLATSGALHEPFVVIDVGVQGGENPRWHFLGDHLVVHGFDAIAEAIADLSKKAPKNRRYHWFAIGDEDGEREFFYKSDNPTNRSFYTTRGPMHQARIVPVRRLDTLLAQGTIPTADFLKVDVEGFERDVLLGAKTTLSAGILGVETETNFNSSPTYPDTHFALVHKLLNKEGLFVFDLNFDRIRRARYLEARRRRSQPELDLAGGGRIATVNVLFCRSMTAERDGSLYYERRLAAPSVDQILKTMAIYELHGLNDVAVDTAVLYSDELGKRVDVERAVDLLCAGADRMRPPDPPEAPQAVVAPTPDPSHHRVALAESRLLDWQRERAALKQQIEALRNSTSWRITAPLRAIVDRVRRALR
jgi:FkbM family methyltransferase